MNAFCIGLTGGIGAGKSLVSERFARLGAEVVDTDLIARELTAPGGAAMAPLLASFGPHMANSAGGLDRAAMRALAFSEAEAKSRLESILHPLIRAEALQRVAVSNAPYVLLVVPLLVEHLAEYWNLIDRLLLVDCAEALQVERALTRPGMDAQQLQAIMSSQASRAERRVCADEVIDNSADLASLDARVSELHAYYSSLAASANRN
jgi:dephospho-CoA kinase